MPEPSLSGSSPRPSVQPVAGKARPRAAYVFIIIGLILALNLGLVALLPRGIYDGDFSGASSDGRGYGWRRTDTFPAGAVLEMAAPPAGSAAGSKAQVIDARAASQAASLLSGLNPAAAGVLVVHYLVDPASTQAATPAGEVRAASLRHGSGPDRVLALEAGPSATGWQEGRLAVGPGNYELTIAAAPGCRVIFADMRFIYDGPLTLLERARAALWGDASQAPAVSYMRVSFSLVWNCGHRGDVLLPVFLVLAFSIVGFLALLVLNYRAAVVLLFAMSFLVVFEPAPFEGLFTAWLAHGLLTRRLDLRRIGALWRPTWSKLVLAGLGALALGSAIAFVAGGPSSISGVSEVTTLYCLTLFVALLAADGPILGLLATGLTVGALVSTAASWGGYLVPALRDYVFLFGSEFRGLFKDSNVFGPSLIFPATLAVMLFLRAGGLKRRLLWLAAAAFLAGGVVMSGSRGAFGGYGVAILVLAWLAAPFASRRARAALPWALAALVLGGVAVGLHPGLGGPLLQLRYYDFGARFPDMIAALKQIPGLPLGLGPGLAPYVLHIEPHNTVLLTLLEDGWLAGLGLVLGLAALLAGARASWLGLRAAGGGPDGGSRFASLSDDAVYVLAGLAALAGLLAVSMLTPSLHWRHLWLVAGLLAAASRRLGHS